jgi:hypothetical protein
MIPKFNWDPFGTGPIPMVVEQINGNADGTSVGINFQNGDTLCYPNHTSYPSDFGIMVNMGGAMGDISWLEDGSTPMISFHVPTDPFAPYQEGIVIVPTTDEQVVEVSGSYSVQAQANAYGNNAIFQSAETFAPTLAYTNAANANNNGNFGLYPIVRSGANIYDSSPWQWWDPAVVAPDNHANGLLTNPDMSATKARTFIDSIQGYAAPRMMCALSLPGNPCDATINVEEVQSEFNLYPNPTNGLFTVNSINGSAIQMLDIYDVAGRRVMSVNPQQSLITLDITELPRGLYTIQLRGENFTQTMRIQRM